MNPRIKRALIATVVAGLLAAGGYYGWKTLHPSGPGEDFNSGNGRMEATEIDVAAKSGGRVLNIFANEGDFARAGQPLAQMQVDALEAQHDEVLAQYQQAIQSVANAEAQLAARHSDKAAAEAALAQRESDVAAARAVVSQRESDVEAAQAVVGERESELDAARRRLARSQVLSKEGASSIQENDDDRSRMATAEAALKAATAQVAAARAAVDAAKAQVATAGAAVSAARAQVATAEATINATQAQVAGVQRAVLASKAAIARCGGRYQGHHFNLAEGREGAIPRSSARRSGRSRRKDPQSGGLE